VIERWIEREFNFLNKRERERKTKRETVRHRQREKKEEQKEKPDSYDDQTKIRISVFEF
jgi:hypothetical protein